MSQYLKNDFCEFELLTPVDLTIKKDIFVTTLFRLYTGGYKNFIKYLDGLKELNNVANKKDIYIRLFIDMSISRDDSIMGKLRKLNRVQIVLYKCSEFIINDHHHVGLFGTLMRFFPLFDFENNDAGVTFLCDADIDRNFEEKTKFYDVLKNDIDLNKLYIAYPGYYYIHSNEKLEKDGKKYILPYCMAGSLIGIKKIPKESFVKYLKKLKDYMNNSPPREILSNYYISPEKYKILCENNICYGIDEYYINNILLTYLFKHDLPFCFKYRYNIYDGLYFRIEPNNVYSIDNLQGLSRDEYKKIFDEYMKESGLGKYNINYLEKKLYVKKFTFMKATPFMLEFKNIMVPFIKKLYERKDFRIYKPSQFYMLFTNDYDKYFCIEQIKFVNINHDPIVLKAIEF